jgi:hypothetical protein
MHMMKPVAYIDGFLNVYPNFRHGKRQDGIGCSRLSPKSLGQVNHNMPGLPPAVSLENFHQCAKFFRFELDDQGDILPERPESKCTTVQYL